MLGSHRSLGWSYNYTYMTNVNFISSGHGIISRWSPHCLVQYMPNLSFVMPQCSPKKKIGRVSAFKTPLLCNIRIQNEDLADFGSLESLNIFSLVFMPHIPVIFQLSSYIHRGFLQWGYPKIARWMVFLIEKYRKSHENWWWLEIPPF